MVYQMQITNGKSTVLYANKNVRMCESIQHKHLQILSALFDFMAFKSDVAEKPS